MLPLDKTMTFYTKDLPWYNHNSAIIIIAQNDFLKSVLCAVSIHEIPIDVVVC